MSERLISDKEEENCLFPDIIRGDSVIHRDISSEDELFDVLIDIMTYIKENKMSYIKKIFIGEFEYSLIEDYKSLIQCSSPTEIKMKYNIGQHIQKSSGKKKTCTIGEALECYTPTLPYQIFMGSPQNLKFTPTASHNNDHVFFIHGPYVANLCNFAIVDDVAKIMREAEYQKAVGVVFHVGKPAGKYKEEDQEAVICQIIEKSGIKEVDFILETPAGQGSETLTDYREFMSLCLSIQSKFSNFSVCVDTCHVFACGYSPYYYLKEMLDNGVRVSVIHFNDSVGSWMSNKDRHANIGEGRIPLYDLEKCAKLAFENNIPLILETPDVKGV